MKNKVYTYEAGEATHEMEMIFVPGTNGSPYLFGVDSMQHEIDVGDFYIGKFPVTQSLWMHIMGEAANRSNVRGDHRPVQNVNWYDVTNEGGFLDKINASEIFGKQFKFRLPSETEWEYAARGGPHWKDNFILSGGNDANKVCWYRDNSGDRMHEVGWKQPNQLGLYDMSGNQWEWCQDLFIRDTNQIPVDGSPYEASGTDRVLRGGCYHNYHVHCTVSKRYEIFPEFGDGCISFRLVLAANN